MNLSNLKFAFRIRRGVDTVPHIRCDGRARYPHRAAETQLRNLQLSLLICLCVAFLGLTGCQSLRPVADLTHYYVLSASATAPAQTQSNRDLTIGIAPVEIPAYLQSSRIVVRTGGNEIHYSDYREWGEHLDKGIQRVLAGDISILMPGVRTVTSSWQGSDVKAEVYVSIQRFELDENGEVTLDCQWRIIGSGATRALHSNHFKGSKKGPSLVKEPAGAVNTLSGALVGLSKEIAAALKSLSSAP
jgi:uncharacterized lipoprotein YmbA